MLSPRPAPVHCNLPELSHRLPVRPIGHRSGPLIELALCVLLSHSPCLTRFPAERTVAWCCSELFFEEGEQLAQQQVELLEFFGAESARE